MKDMNLGGFMFWALDLDDFNNVCGFGRYPLIQAAKDYALDINSPTPSCQEKIFDGICPTTTTTTIAPGQCQVNPDGLWAGDAAMDSWCKNPGNCPQPTCGNYTSGC